MTRDLKEHARRAAQYLRSGTDYHRPFLERWLPESGLIGDIGCEVGRVAVCYDRPGRRAIGVDVNLEALVAAKSLGAGLFVGADAFNLPLADGVLAAYVGLGVIEFDPTGGRSALLEAKRVLQPHGLLYLSVAFLNVSRRKSGKSKWRGGTFPAYSMDDIKALLGSTGFDIILLRPSSLAWGLGPFRPAARLLRRALIQEDETALSYRLLFPLLRRFANSLLVIGRRVPDSV